MTEFTAGAALVLALLTFVLQLIRLRKGENGGGSGSGGGHSEALRSEMRSVQEEIKSLRKRVHNHANILQRIMGKLKIDIDNWEE